MPGISSIASGAHLGNLIVKRPERRVAESRQGIVDRWGRLCRFQDRVKYAHQWFGTLGMSFCVLLPPTVDGSPGLLSVFPTTLSLSC